MRSAVFKRAVADLPQELLADGLMARSAVRTDGALVTFLWLAPGFDAGPPHRHPFDQLAFVLGGVLEFEIDGESFVVESGEMLYIPAGHPHTARVIGDEHVLNVDLFAPAREDYAYLTEWQRDS